MLCRFPCRGLAYFRSISLKGSPHSGQNFGGWAGSAGFQPQLLHWYTPAGSGCPHSEQNLPTFSAPHWGHFHAASGLGLPHSTQNLPVFSAPQAHFQLPAGADDLARAAGRAPAAAHLIEGLGVGAAGLTGHIHPHKGHGRDLRWGWRPPSSWHRPDWPPDGPPPRAGSIKAAVALKLLDGLFVLFVGGDAGNAAGDDLHAP